MLPIPIKIGDVWPKGRELNEIISYNPTKEALDEYCKQNKDYKVDDIIHEKGATLVELLRTNDGQNYNNLLNHIIKLGDHVLNGGSADGTNLLTKAIINYAVSRHRNFVKFDLLSNEDKTPLIQAVALCHLGANVNVYVCRTNFTESMISALVPHYISKATPLWLAAEATRDLDLIDLLLLCGAHVGENDLSTAGMKRIMESWKRVQADEAGINALAKVIAEEDQHCHLSKIPKDLINTISRYGYKLKNEIIQKYSDCAERENLTCKVLFK